VLKEGIQAGVRAAGEFVSRHGLTAAAAVRDKEMEFLFDYLERLYSR